MFCVRAEMTSSEGTRTFDPIRMSDQSPGRHKLTAVLQHAAGKQLHVERCDFDARTCADSTCGASPFTVQACGLTEGLPASSRE